MHYFFEVSVPASREEKNPYEKRLPLSYGVITGCVVLIPAGHAGKAHLQLLRHDFQIYPLSRGENYHGDDAEIAFTDRFFLDAAPYELKARGWNTDTEHSHAFLLGFELLLPEQIGMQTGVLGIAELQALIGSTIGG